MLYGFGASGGLIKDKASFNLNVFGNSSYDTPNLNVALPTGTISRALNLKSPRDNVFINGQLDYALTLDQTIRFGYNAVHVSNENAGIGGYDEPERAAAARSHALALSAHENWTRAYLRNAARPDGYPPTAERQLQQPDRPERDGLARREHQHRAALHATHGQRQQQRWRVQRSSRRCWT
jgi:hypothetical protein